MARATNIYVVRDLGASVYLDVLATFTVKHECIRWLKGYPHPSELTIDRFPDGGNGTRASFTFEEFCS